MSFHDFAGSTVVHTIGGFIALAGSIVLGPRLGRKFKRDGGGPMMPHDLTIARQRRLASCGSAGTDSTPAARSRPWTLSASGASPTNTTLAACAAGLTSMLYGFMHEQEVGRGLHDQRLPRRPGRDHLPLLLGQPHRRGSARRQLPA